MQNKVTVKYRINKLLYSLFLSSLLLFVSMPANAHAQSMFLEHGSIASAMNTCDDSCSVQDLAPCACTSAAMVLVPENQRLVENEQDNEPDPNAWNPYFLPSIINAPRKLANKYLGGAPSLRPPDLVILYANIRR